jgi:hypothetical protein
MRDMFATNDEIALQARNVNLEALNLEEGTMRDTDWNIHNRASEIKKIFS